jgi:hypothetical protein
MSHNLCPTCLDHPGWASSDLSRRRDPHDVCRDCFGSGTDLRIEPGTRVRYRGSLTDQHGYYTVQHRLHTGRYNLVDGEGLCPDGQTLANVGRASIVPLVDHDDERRDYDREPA